MAKYLTKRQKLFCKYFMHLSDPYEAAIKAGYAETTARCRANSWLKNPYFQKHLGELQQKENYSINAYINELDKAIELAYKSQNPATLIKAIEAKGKAFGFDKLTISDLKNNTGNFIKEDIFDKIREKADVFKKFEQNNTESNLPGDGP